MLVPNLLSLFASVDCSRHLHTFLSLPDHLVEYHAFETLLSRIVQKPVDCNV